MYLICIFFLRKLNYAKAVPCVGGKGCRLKIVNEELDCCILWHINLSLLFNTNSLIVFNWKHFEMRLLNLRINFFFFLLQTFCSHLGSFCVVSSSLRFGQISPLAFFRRLTVTSDRYAESCNRIPRNYCLP